MAKPRESADYADFAEGRKPEPFGRPTESAEGGLFLDGSSRVEEALAIDAASVGDFVLAMVG